jgi:uncharacterized repeat protein (TIGR01451 family)
MSRIVSRTLHAVAALALVAGSMTGLALAAGTPAGTVISNQATVNFTDVNGNPLTQLSNVVTTTVSQVAAVTVAPDNASNADPGDVVVYAHTVTNNGNDDDTFDLSATSSQGWTVAIYADAGVIGVYEPGTDLPIADTGVLTADAVYTILVTVAVPAGAANGTVDTTTVTATSQFNVGVSDSATDTTTIDAPALAVVKSVSPTGDQPPGTVLTYTIVITNSGAGAANSVVMRDPVPANTVYVSSSIVQDGNPKGDGTGDGDNADHNVTNPGEVTVNVGTLAAGGSTTISFQVQIL